METTTATTKTVQVVRNTRDASGRERLFDITLDGVRIGDIRTTVTGQWVGAEMSHATKKAAVLAVVRRYNRSQS